MKKSIKSIVLLIALSCTQVIKSLEIPDHTNTDSPSVVRTVNPVATAATTTIASDGSGSDNSVTRARAVNPKKPRRLNRVVAFELPTLQFTRDRKTTTAPDQATIVEWDSATSTGRPRRASSFSDLRELAESTQARPAPGVNRSVRVMLVPDPIDLSAQIDAPALIKIVNPTRATSPARAAKVTKTGSPRAHSPLFKEDSCVIEIGDTCLADSKATRDTHATPKLTHTDSTRMSDTAVPVGAPDSTLVIARASASSNGHDPLVLALAASLKVYTEQNSEFLRNQAEQNKVAAEERNTTRRGVRDAKIIGAVATVGTLVGPYIAPYITAWVKSWI